MRGTKFAVAVLAAIVVLASAALAQPTGVQFVGVGSSAMFNTLSAASFSDVCSARTGSDCHHWSISGVNPNDNQNWAQAVDSRSSSIPVEGGTLFIAWDNNTVPVAVWAYLSVDSILGNRLFFANPRATLQIDGGATSKAGANKVPAAILLNRQTGVDQADDASLPSAVINVLATNPTFTAALSDVRAEDAKFEINRTLAAYSVTGSGLGYGNPSNATCFQSPDSWPVSAILGCPVYGTWGARATPVQYALTGKDPFTSKPAWKYKSIDVGAEPVVFVYNATDANGLGAVNAAGNPAFTNLNTWAALYAFNGTLGLSQDLDPSLTTALQGLGTNPPFFPILREPTSGTMTTTEFNVFRSIETQKELPDAATQETGINLGNSCTVGSNCPDPLYLPGPSGSARFRAIGTGAEISGQSGVGGILNLADSIGYAFFSFGNVHPITSVGRYVTLDGVDPINQGYGAYTFNGNNYGPGALPNCVAPCQATGGTSLPNVRNGSYPAWTIIRALTDATGVNLTNTQNLITLAQNEVNNTTADFVPFVCTNATTCNINGGVEPGLTVFHSHFTITGVATKADNGIISGHTEIGGDAGGAVFTDQADLAFFADTGKEIINIRK